MNVAIGGQLTISICASRRAGAAERSIIEVNGVDRTGPLVGTEHGWLAGLDNDSEVGRCPRSRDTDLAAGHGHEWSGRCRREFQLHQRVGSKVTGLC